METTISSPSLEAGRARVHTETGTSNRRERAKARTHTALVQAAQRFIRAGQRHVPILEITKAADVGLGSFYNHFESREALYEVAVDEALDALGARLDQLGASLDDPAEVLAQAFRLTGRLFRLEPELMQVAMSAGPGMMQAKHGLVPYARRDLESGIRAGRFSVTDVELALGMVVGSAMCLGEILRQGPDRDAASSTDRMAAAVLRMLGVPADEADRIASAPLPDATVQDESAHSEEERME
ncbi:MAG: TetR/AcrR family transcriptional regulator [Candidatus Dormibacteria bacterium]